MLTLLAIPLTVLTAVIPTLTAPAPAFAPPEQVRLAAQAKDDDRHILVRFRPGTAGSERAAAHRRNGARTENALRPERVEVVRLARDDTVEAALVRYRRNPNVEFAEPNRAVTVTVTPNDPYFPGNGSLSGHDLWGLHNTGQNSGSDDADIDAPEGWDAFATSGSPWPTDDYAVGVIDTGINAAHEDFAGKSIDPCYSALTGTGTLSSGCADTDVLRSHGTHVSGTIAASANNGKGISGAAPNARLYMCKALGADGTGYVADVVACMNEIVAKRDTHKIRVLSMSLATPTATKTLEAAVDNAWTNGVLVVAAAGNDGDTTVNYPAGYANAVSVAASDRNDARASFSNANPDVELSAPGVAVLSTVMSGGYEAWSGTSMATPHAAAAAALLSRKSGKTGQALRDALDAGVDDLGPAGRDPAFGFGRVNLCLALGGCAAATADTTPPAAPTSVSATAGNGRVNVDWPDVSNPDFGGYRVFRRAGTGTWSQIATTSSSAFTDTKVTIGTPYTYRVTAYDRSENESAPSPEAAAKPTVKTYSPAAYKRVFGSIYSDRGALWRLFSDDGYRLELSAAKNSSGTYISDFYAHATMSSAERAAVRKLSTAYNGNASSRYAALSLYVYKYSSSRWVRVDGPRTGVTSDRSFGWSTLSPRHYLSSSGTVRFRVRGTRKAGFRTRTDLVRFRLDG